MNNSKIKCHRPTCLNMCLCYSIQASFSLSIYLSRHRERETCCSYQIKNITFPSHILPEGVVASIAVILVFIRGCFVSLLFLLHLSAERLCAAALRLSSRRVSGDRGSAFVLHRAPLASVAHVRGYNEANRRIVSVMFFPFRRSLNRIGRGASSYPRRCASVAQWARRHPDTPWHNLLNHKATDYTVLKSSPRFANSLS